METQRSLRFGVLGAIQKAKIFNYCSRGNLTQNEAKPRQLTTPGANGTIEKIEPTRGW